MTHLLLLASQPIGKHSHLLAHGGRGCCLAMRPGQHGHVCKSFGQACDGLRHLHCSKQGPSIYWPSKPKLTPLQATNVQIYVQGSTMCI